jgi:hypothetical protein
MCINVLFVNCCTALYDYSTIVDRNHTILAEAYTSVRQGETWDPANIVTDVLRTGREYTDIIIMAHITQCDVMPLSFCACIRLRSYTRSVSTCSV